MSMSEHVHTLRTYMGELLGPKPVREIVITSYEDGTVNYQIEGMHGPVDPADAYKLLAIVAQQVAPQITAPQEEATT